MRRRCACGAARACSCAGRAGHDPLRAAGAITSTAGRPLDPGLREEMEGRLHADFSRVRVHDGQAAAASAQALGARAYTLGEHIVLGESAAPRSTEGRRVWAHELAHVMQNQAGGAARATPQALALGGGDDPAEVEAERLADHATRSSADSAAPDVRSGASSGVVRRLLFVRDPGQRPTHEPSLAGRTNAAWVQEWLRTLCPNGKPSVDTTTGEVGLGDSDACPQTAGAPEPLPLLQDGAPPTRAAPSGASVACTCLCEGVHRAERIDIQVSDRITVPAKPQKHPERDLSVMGEGKRIGLDDPQLQVANPTIVVSGRDTSVAGHNPTAPKKRMIVDPAWLILSHELCGHELLARRSPEDFATGSFESTNSGHSQTREGTRSTGDIENLLRRDHDLGTRTEGAWYRLQSNDNPRHLEFRFGIVVNGRRAFARVGSSWLHRSIFVPLLEHSEDVSLLEREFNMRLTLARSAHTEILVLDAAWDNVMAGDTWASIAARWGVGPRGRRSGADRVRDANDGITLLLHPGARVIIPAR